MSTAVEATKSSVSDLWNSNAFIIENLQDDAEKALTALVNEAMSSSSVIYHEALTAFADPNVQAIDTGALPAAPDIGSAQFVEPNVQYIDVSALPTVEDILSRVREINPDPFPTAPAADEIEKYKRHVWEDSHLDSLLTTVMAQADAMGMPSQAHQDAIFDQDRERKQRALADAIDIIKAQTSGRGFKYATGQTNAAILDLTQKHQYDLENQSREITKLCEEWARQNFQFAIQQGISIEQLHMDFAYKYSTIHRELYTALLSAVLEKFRTQVQMELEKLKATTDAVMTRATAYKTNADISATSSQIYLEKYRTETDAAVRQHEADVRVFATRADALKGNAEIATVTGRLRLDKYRADIEQAATHYNGAIEIAKLNANRQLSAHIAYANTASGLIQATTNNTIGVMTQKVSSAT